MKILILAIVIIASVRTAMYGIWTFNGKNITGGIFVLLLSLCTVWLSARFLLR